MRTIKFRAWNKEGKKMVDLQKLTPLALSDMMNTQLSLHGWSGLFIPFQPDIELMQYTGLKDKNGKEIYEGDVVEYIIDNQAYGKFLVKWDDEGFWDCGINNKKQEVIGNIYENPELLKN